MKIMIVDDHREWRQFLRGLLEPCHSITECHDGQSAIAADERESPDWILMDIAMEPMDGLTAASIIKTRHPAARIIFVTQHTDRMFRDQASHLGFAFLPKEEAWRLRNLIHSAPASA